MCNAATLEAVCRILSIVHNSRLVTRHSSRQSRDIVSRLSLDRDLFLSRLTSTPKFVLFVQSHVDYNSGQCIVLCSCPAQCTVIGSQ